MNEISARARPRVAPLARDLIALTKPRVTALVLLTEAAGIWLSPGHMPARSLFLSLAGTALVVGSANALNMWWERDSDALMARTRDRPLPSGRMSPDVALAFGLLLGAVSAPMLFAINSVTGTLALVSLVAYVAVYTPLKRRTYLALPVGAIPGAMPPLLGWTSATASIDVGGAALFVLLFLWQMAHFAALSIFLEADYRSAGARVVSVQRGDRFARRAVVAAVVLVVASSFALVRFGLGGGGVSIGVACVAGAAFVVLALHGLRPGATTRWARLVFHSSNAYLTILIAALLVERTMR